MEICYADRPLSKSDRPAIFLAGPTTRSRDVISWRPQALEILSDLQFAGRVFVPERSQGVTQVDSIEEFEWDATGLGMANAIAFWVPRNMKTLPALTTNVEFGRYVSIASDRVFYGRPDTAEKISYLDWLYERHTGRKPVNQLRSLLAEAIAAVS